ncbi:MAG: protein kinase [Archangium sp.]|nr:protein kinase [Archangium sp.]
MSDPDQTSDDIPALQQTAPLPVLRDAHLEESEFIEFSNNLMEASARQAALRHLDTCQRCREVLSELHRDDDGHGSTKLKDPLLGRMLGEYRVEDALSRGGMGVVYRGVHPVIGKKVAIKVLLPEAAADPDQMDRLLAEARAVNAIRHPNIIDIFSFGTLPDGKHYFVMELLDGEPLNELLREKGRLSAPEVMVVIEQTMAALAAAHAANVIHRDLKPANLFVSTLPDKSWHVTVLDFGLAKQLGVSSSTAPNLVMGTPGYMAPEQIRGQKLSPKVDLYAVGAVAWVLLTGREPFEANSFVDLMVKHLEEPLPSLARAAPDCPSALVQLVEKLLAKRPEQRPSSALEVQQTVLRMRKELHGRETMKNIPPPMVPLDQLQKPHVRAAAPTVPAGDIEKTQPRDGPRLPEPARAVKRKTARPTRYDRPAAERSSQPLEGEGELEQEHDDLAPVAPTPAAPPGRLSAMLGGAALTLLLVGAVALVWRFVQSNDGSQGDTRRSGDETRTVPPEDPPKFAEAKDSVPNTDAPNVDAKNTDAKNTDAKNTDAKNTDAKNTDAKNTDTKNADAKNADLSSDNTEAKNADLLAKNAGAKDAVVGAKNTGADAKSTDAKSTGAKDADAKSSDKNTGAKDADAKTTDTKTTDTKSSDAKTTDAKSSDAKTGAKSSDAKTTDAKSSDAKTGAKSNDAKTTDAKSSDAKTTDAKNTDAKNTDAKSTDAKNTDAKNTGTKAPTLPRGPTAESVQERIVRARASAAKLDSGPVKRIVNTSLDDLSARLQAKESPKVIASELDELIRQHKLK